MSERKVDILWRDPEFRLDAWRVVTVHSVDPEHNIFFFFFLYPYVPQCKFKQIKNK